MKRKIGILLTILGLVMTAFVGVKPVVFASDENATVITSDDYRLQADYLDFYSVPTSEFTFENNGGELSGNALAKAFDRNYSTSFKSAQDNNVSYLDPVTNETKQNFINYIDVTFSQKTALNRIIYASENGMTRGYPTNLNLYYDNGAGLTLIKNYITTETSSFVVFDFGQTIETTKFRFEYVKVSTNHKYVATAKEIIFLQPENSDFALYSAMFSGYTQTTLNSNLSTFEKLCEFENKLKSNINYPKMQDKFDRAKEVALGKVNFNPKREFSTDSTAQNVIHQYGDISKYCHNDLQTSSFGTNRQVMGILSTPGQVVNIYVEAPASDPFPRIRFSQHVGHWRSWLGGELQLKRGKNTFTTPNFKHNDYSIDVALGGPIYIVNPYTSAEQSENVKVYVEGGSLYPVLTAQSNEKVYMHELKEYAKKVNADPSNVVNLSEIVTDHAIITLDATRAYEFYQNNSPLQTVQNWNSFMDELLEFGGITQNSSSPVFDERNLYANFNIRVVQPWTGAAAYAAAEHVGVYSNAQGILLKGSDFGWAVPHEIGHMLDNINRTIGETTNNMYAKYNETAIQKLNTRGDFSKTVEALSSDLTYNKKDFFNSNRYNYLIWWYIESWQKGFWGDLENCYRGTYPKIKEFWSLYPDLKSVIGDVKKISRTELQVFYASIATGVDMSYYFDRWGYSITYAKSDDSEAGSETTVVKTDDPVFKIATAGDTFNDLMSKARSSGYVDNSKQYKLWYQNNLAYHNHNTTPAYSDATMVSIKYVSKSENGFNILIDHTENENHLGYEILEGDETNGYKVIGFTYEASFVDSTKYAEGYSPSYKIVAVDNTFNTSRQSEAKQVEEFSDIICVIGETGYTTLSQAVTSATSGDVIKLKKSFSTTNILIDKNITITLADDVVADLTVYKVEPGDLFTVKSGITLTIIGTDTLHIILDGNGFSQNGAIFSISGVVNANNLILQNNFSSGAGVIVMQGGSNGSLFKNCTIKDNRASVGSAFYCNYANVNFTFENVTFENNSSTGDGIIANKGKLALTDCVVKNNTAKNGIVKNYAGGILNVAGGEISGNTAEIGAGLHIDGFTNIKDVAIKDNTSTIQATVYYKSNMAVRKLTIENSEFANNSSPSGSVLIVEGGTLTLNNVTALYGEMGLIGGKTIIKNDCAIASKILVKNGTEVVLKSGTFTGIESCTFEPVEFAQNMKILVFEDYVPSNADLDKIKSANDKIQFILSKYLVLAVPKNVQITISVNGENKTYNYDYGTTISLDFDISDSKYISKIKDGSGVEYDRNDTILALNDDTYTVTLADKIKVKFVYKNSEKIMNYIPYLAFNLPTENKESSKIIGWKNTRAFYLSGESVLCDSDTEFVAVYERLFKLTLKDGDETLFEDYFEYGSQVDLTTLQFGVVPDYWQLNGIKSLDVITIRGDVELTVGYLPIDKPKPKPFPVISVITASFVGVVVIVLLIIYLIHKRKNKS